MDLEPHILQVEPPVYYHNLFVCCWYWPVTRSARFVAILSLLSFIVNLALLICTSIQSALHLLVEVSILLIELVCIVCLFYGLSHKKADYLKPYLFFGVIWNACLIILWVLCLIQLFDKNGFRFDVLLSTSEFIELNTDIETFESTSFWLTIFLIIGLTVTIALGFWFLHIVLSSYHYFIDRQLTIWDHQPESKHLLIEEPSIYVKTHKDSDAQNDPATEVLLSDEYVNKNCKNAL